MSTLEQAITSLTSAQDADPSGYYTSKYSGEEIDALLDWVAAQQEESP